MIYQYNYKLYDIVYHKIEKCIKSTTININLGWINQPSFHMEKGIDFTQIIFT